MKIVRPAIEHLIETDDYVSHVAQCARICYASDNNKDKELIDNLIKLKHYSMFRHRTLYYKIPSRCLTLNTINILQNCPYIDMILNVHNENFFISVNGHYYINHINFFESLKQYKVDKDVFENNDYGREVVRVTYKVTTQIGTSRELNRVSPNNISEQSTRYVNFNKKGNCVFCLPHWFDFKGNELEYIYSHNIHYLKSDLEEDFHPYENSCITKELYNQPVVQAWLLTCYNIERTYNDIIKLGAKPQDARGILILDTATICAYTYSIRQWREIIDARYYGTTGAPHPNAKIIAGMIREDLMNNGYEFR